MSGDPLCALLPWTALRGAVFFQFVISKPNRAECALLIVGHGSTVNPDSSAPTWAHADAIRRWGLFAEVHAAFWKEEPSLRQVLYGIESREIYVVPNFISEGYFTQKVIPRELGLPLEGLGRGPVILPDGRTLRYCEPVGSHRRMTEVLLRRASEVAPGVPSAEVSLLIVGHGTDLNDNSAVAAKEQVRRIRAMGLYAEVLAAYMDEAPRIEDWATLATQRRVIVVPFFVSDGLHSYQDIPERLGLEPGPARSLAPERSDVFRNNPHLIQGRELYYASAIGTEPLFAEVILDQVTAFEERCA
jgi:sirohydrochlorin cobaltochelatase